MMIVKDYVEYFKSWIVERLHVIGMSGCNLRFRNGCFIPKVTFLHFFPQKASFLFALRRRYLVLLLPIGKIFIEIWPFEGGRKQMICNEGGI